MKISQIAAYLRKMSGEMQDYAARNDDMDLPDEVVLPCITKLSDQEPDRFIIPFADTNAGRGHSRV